MTKPSVRYSKSQSWNFNSYVSPSQISFLLKACSLRFRVKTL